MNYESEYRQKGATKRRIALFLLLSPVIGGALAGVPAAAIFLIKFFTDPPQTDSGLGLGVDPFMAAFLVFILFGFVGSVLGLLGGLIGAIVVANRR